MFVVTHACTIDYSTCMYYDHVVNVLVQETSRMLQRMPRPVQAVQSLRLRQVYVFVPSMIIIWVS